jgi:uracil-DNA glycosylase family 4
VTETLPRKRIPGVGPLDAILAAVGEAPGREEHFRGSPFVGKAGIVLGTYMRAAGLKRRDTFITNVHPYWPGPGNPTPTEKMIREEEHWLEKDLKKRRKLKVIAAVGRPAARWFLGDVDMETHHGIPMRSEKTRAIVVPCYHPAAGFYDPRTAARCQDDFRVVREVLEGTWTDAEKAEVPKARPAKSRGYHYSHTVCSDCALDTEGTVSRPWGLSWSGGKAAYVSRKKISTEWAYPFRTVFHYALHDLPVLRSMGYDTDEWEYDDTMVMAFVLQLEPQALKTLAYRHLGVEMQEYEDVVRPYFDTAVREWIEKVLEREAELPPAEEVLVKEKGVWRIKKPHKMATRLRSLLKSKTPEKNYPDLPEKMRGLGESIAGPFPNFSEALFLVPDKEAVQYAGTDAWATRKLSVILKKKIHERGLDGVYEMDRAALPYVDMMQQAGMPVDVEKAKELDEELRGDITKLEKELNSIVGRKDFNHRSTDDLGEVLFRQFNLPRVRLTRTGQDSVDKKVIKILRAKVVEEEQKVFLDKLVECKEMEKLNGTFVAAVLNFAKETDIGWRLFFDLKTTRVVSGRLSSADPNILAFPVRTPLGKRVRKLFVARRGWIILSVDQSQIELRVMAHESQDKRMLEAFRNEEDLHDITTMLIFKLKEFEFTEAQRYTGKTLNFAIMYGITARALLESLHAFGIYDYTLRNCDGIIKEWFKAYPGVRQYLEGLWEEARKTGEVRDMWGRVRYVPNIRLPRGPLYEATKREVGNLPIQAGAHGLVKRAEGRLVGYMRENREEVLPILQIHDELLMEVRRANRGRVERKVRRELEADKGMFSVPIKTDAEWGPSWGELK